MVVLGKEFRKEIGRFLYGKRFDAGLTQAQVAAAAGLKTSQSISNIERGSAPVPLDLLKLFIQLYKINPKIIESIMVDQYRRALHETLNRPVAKLRKTKVERPRESDARHGPRKVKR